MNSRRLIDAPRADHHTLAYRLDECRVVRHSKSGHSMSALGQKRTLQCILVMSALPPKADIAERDRHVRFVPKADILRCGRDWRYSITSSASNCMEVGTF